MNESGEVQNNISKEEVKKEVKKFIIWLIVALILLLPFEDIPEMVILPPPLNWTDKLISIYMAITKGIKAFSLIHTFNGAKNYVHKGTNMLHEIDPEAANVAEQITDIGLSVAEASLATKTGIVGGTIAKDANIAEKTLKDTEVAASVITDGKIIETVTKKIANSTTKNMDLF